MGVNLIGYVPTTNISVRQYVAENIGFWRETKNIDFVRVENAAKIACIIEMILSKLSAGYDTMVGEQGADYLEEKGSGLQLPERSKPKLLIYWRPLQALDMRYERRHGQRKFENIQSGMSIIAQVHPEQAPWKLVTEFKF